MLTEEQKRVHRVCFTGHRPEKLNLSESVIVKALETAIKEAIADGKNVFISGSLTTCNLQKSVDILQKSVIIYLACRCGGIGRHKGLKIRSSFFKSDSFLL